MKNPNGYGQIIKLSGRRRKRYAVRISAGYRQRICIPNRSEFYPDIIDKFDMKYRKSKNDYVMYCDDDEVKEVAGKVTEWSGSASPRVFGRKLFRTV